MNSSEIRIEFSKLLLPAVFSAAFLILYIILSSNNRFAADDYFFLENVSKQGIWNGMLTAYNSWVTRWFAILFLNVALRSYILFHSLLPYHLITLLVFTFAVMNFIRALTERFLRVKIPVPVRFLYAVLFTASFFFFTFNTGETWFWITCTSMYLWSIIFFIIGLTCIILTDNKVNWLTRFICAFCFLFIGGASESTAISILFLLIAGVIYTLYKIKFSFNSFLREERNKLLLISLVAIGVALLISYMGEGRILRQSALPKTGILTAKFIAAKSILKLLLFYLPLKIHWFIFFSVPWIYLGYQYNSEKKESLEKVLRQIAVFVFIFLLLSFISFIPVSYLLGETGPFRTWILASLYLAVCCLVCGFYLGYKIEWKKKLLHRAFNISLSTLIVMMTINISEQNKITSKYAAAVDQRMIYLTLLQKEKRKTVELEPLPSSGMLYSAEISEDSSHFSNLHLKKIMDLPFDIRKK